MNIFRDNCPALRVWGSGSKQLGRIEPRYKRRAQLQRPLRATCHMACSLLLYLFAAVASLLSRASPTVILGVTPRDGQRLSFSSLYSALHQDKGGS